VPLAQHVNDRGLGEVVAELGFVLSKDPDTVRAPDIAYLSRATLARVRDEDRYVSGAPDVAVEVLSPSNRRAAIRSKVADFLAAGARLVWVVDPARRRVTVYETLLSPRVLGEGEMLDGGDVVPGFSLPLSKLFSR
jgi:Uma2 family endonuclease